MWIYQFCSVFWGPCLEPKSSSSLLTDQRRILRHQTYYISFNIILIRKTWDHVWIIIFLKIPLNFEFGHKFFLLDYLLNNNENSWFGFDIIDLNISTIVFKKIVWISENHRVNKNSFDTFPNLVGPLCTLSENTLLYFLHSVYLFNLLWLHIPR